MSGAVAARAVRAARREHHGSDTLQAWLSRRGTPTWEVAMGWLTALVAVVAGVLSALRLVSVKGWTRYAAGIELFMAIGMAHMSLPATAGSFGQYGLWWAAAFALTALGSTAAATTHALRHGWRHGIHWAHQVLASGVMVIMALMAVPASSTDTDLAHGSMAGMPGMDMGSMPGMESHSAAAAQAHAHTSAGADPVWRVAFAALAVYFLLSMAASIWTWLRGEGRSIAGTGGKSGRPGRAVHRLLVTLDSVVDLLVYMTASLWARAQTAGGVASPLNAGAHRRRPGADASADAAFTAHLAMATSMSVMLWAMAS
ncbi:DUF5134 domain-containing protein [Nonomuraea basaltis]|uniref:DUF5134 domain-containing protein n=1 Tax=Nonomuraea basaltis TaxID=2495887 RepID=UPI00110C4B6D|nr:DUF5134 domain-containing protein [Nonomuraea basaltis]TMR95757.1 DUF5134 domain-containing protein [Nonomuraea basaltis]